MPVKIHLMVLDTVDHAADGYVQRVFTHFVDVIENEPSPVLQLAVGTVGTVFEHHILEVEIKAVIVFPHTLAGEESPVVAAILVALVEEQRRKSWIILHLVVFVVDDGLFIFYILHAPFLGGFQLHGRSRAVQHPHALVMRGIVPGGSVA